jgi:hypothetical protein
MTSATDFRWTRSLIARAAAATDAWLAAGEHLQGDPARALGMHRHEDRAA